MERILIALCAAFIMMHFQPKSTNHKLIFIILVMVFSYLITRNIQPVGRDIGFLPGDVNDKMMPWMAPIMDNFRHGFKDIWSFGENV